MKYLTIKSTGEKVSQEILGTMRLITRTVTPEGKKVYTGVPIEDVEKLIQTAMDAGINFIDTADAYGHGLAEQLLGEVFTRNPAWREKLFIQTKCGVISNAGGRCNSADGAYIIECVNAALERMKTTYIDSLLLHMPDPLFDPQDVAQAFDQLYKEGKVRYFGVSNWTSGNIALLMKYSKQPITFDQEQFSIVHSNMIDGMMAVNQDWDISIQRDTEKITFCQLNDIQLQAYSTVIAQTGEGIFINNPKYEQLNVLLDKLAEKYNTNKNAIALAWILRLPANIQPVVGTTSAKRLLDSAEATEFELTRQEWYDLYQSTGKPKL